MWFGASSRVLFPLRKTEESLSKVSLPSAAGYAAARPVVMISWLTSGSVRALPGGNAPRVAVIAPASAPPTQKPRPKAWRMLRTRRRSSQTKLSRRAES